MTTANIITLVRIALIPLFLILAPMGGTKTTAALVIFVVASLTDGVDGYIARKYKQVTNFGKFIDPLADKLLVLSAILVFVSKGVVPVWAAMIVLSREFLVTSLRMVAAAEGKVIAAAAWGKIKTFVQIICIIILLLDVNFVIIEGYLTVQSLCSWLMAAVAVISGFSYVKNNLSVIAEGLTQKGS